jgi:YHS domain-containing protein
MNVTQENVGRVSAAIYTCGSLALAGAFFLGALAGNYDWVARLGGAAWVFLLSMVILMTTVPTVLRARLTGEAVSFAHDHEAMLREERSKAMVRDSVCGMEIDAASAAASSEYEGTVYYFCSLACQQSFDADPEKYAQATAE